MYTALGVGFTPNSFEFYQEDMVGHDQMEDSIARIVMERFRNARRAKTNNSIYQGKSTIKLLREADYAMEKRYTPEQEAALVDAFGFCPTRYWGVSAAKTVTIANWKSELISDPGALVNIVPTPSPRLPKSSLIKIKESVKQELVLRMRSTGIGDPSMLMSVENGRLHDSVKRFLDDKSTILREVEQAKIVSAATTAAGRIQNRMRDTITEGDFMQAYSTFTFDQVAKGVAFLRFPRWQRRVILSDSQNMKGKAERVWRMIPTFEAVSPWNMFVTNDTRDISTNTGVMQYSEYTKAMLVSLTKDKRYNEESIFKILENFSARSRTWLFPESAETVADNGNKSTWWQPDEGVAVIHHEGYVTGRDLQDFGLTGYEAHETYNLRAEVCCGYTIRAEVIDPTKDLPRSYAATKYDSMGDGVWQGVGVPALLQNSQDRVNVLYAIFENNVDYSMRPPLMVNPEALQNPSDAHRIAPGGKYSVSDLIGGAGSMPEPIRAIRGPSAQYQIIFPIIQQIIRDCDTECGVPSMSDFNSLGKGSLGEFSARVSAAVRRIRNAAFAEDRAMKPIWEVLFQYVLDENPELVENADLDMNYLGLVGLLAKDQERRAKQERLALIMQGAQAGVVPQQAAQYAYTEILQDYGLPTEALGMKDVLIENAIANAMQNGPIGAASNLAGPPQLDGRSAPMNNIQTAVAQPNGGSQIAPPAGM